MKFKNIIPTKESVFRALEKAGIVLFDDDSKPPNGITIIDDNGDKHILPSNYNIFN